jgi:hypothetical protein
MLDHISVVPGLLNNAIKAIGEVSSRYGKILAVTDGAAALVGYESDWAMMRLVEVATEAGLDFPTIKAAIETGKSRAEVARQYRESTPPPKPLSPAPPPMETPSVPTPSNDNVSASLCEVLRIQALEREWETPAIETAIETASKRPAVRSIEFGDPSPVKLRLRDLWLSAMAVRDKGDRAKLQRQLMDHAYKSGLVAAVGDVHAAAGRPRRWGEEDVAHAISWGLRGMDPWCAGEFPHG